MAYVACVLVNFVTLIGVFFTLPLMKKLLGEEVFNNIGEAYVSPEGGSDVESNGGVERGGGGHHEGKSRRGLRLTFSFLFLIAQLTPSTPPHSRLRPLRSLGPRLLLRLLRRCHPLHNLHARRPRSHKPHLARQRRHRRNRTRRHHVALGYVFIAGVFVSLCSWSGCAGAVAGGDG